MITKLSFLKRYKKTDKRRSKYNRPILRLPSHKVSKQSQCCEQDIHCVDREEVNIVIVTDCEAITRVVT